MGGIPPEAPNPNPGPRAGEEQSEEVRGPRKEAPETGPTAREEQNREETPKSDPKAGMWGRGRAMRPDYTKHSQRLNMPPTPNQQIQQC